MDRSIQAGDLRESSLNTEQSRADWKEGLVLVGAAGEDGVSWRWMAVAAALGWL